MSRDSRLIALLAVSLLRPFALAAAAWLILRVLKIRHPASRHAVWTAVLIGMLLLPLVSVMAPHWKLPLLSRKHESAAQSTAFTEPLDATALHTRSALEAPVVRPAVFDLPSVETLIRWCYLPGLFAMVAYRLAGWALLWRVVSRSRPLRFRRLRESADVLTPVAVGMLRRANSSSSIAWSGRLKTNEIHLASARPADY